MSISLRIHAVASSVDARPTTGAALGTICLDSPRLVLGRGDHCDVRLVDPSVSARHATLRQRGSEWVIVDEGSTNGTRLGRRKLSAHAPEPLRSGDRVRLGRVVVDVQISPSPPERSPAARARELALEAAMAFCMAEGEDPRPRVHLEVEGEEPRLCVLDPDRPIVVGRSRHAELSLDDESLSRRHAEIVARAGQVYVRDLGSRAGSFLGGRELADREVAWRPGEVLELGRATLRIEQPALDTLEDLERAPDERVAASELDAREPERAPEPSESEAHDDGFEGLDDVEGVHEALADEVDEPHVEPRPSAPLARRGTVWGATDFAVVLLALGVFSLSAVGYAVLLR